MLTLIDGNPLNGLIQRPEPEFGVSSNIRFARLRKEKSPPTTFQLRKDFLVWLCAKCWRDSTHPWSPDE